ncbi:MAG TPA: HAD-IIIA family hydrolase [Chthoniobacteraceae bacterium]|nr:HAD-IIIA family hydrolase [Chthoniobacteraceae bacterium]
MASNTPFLRLAHFTDLHFRHSLPGTSVRGHRRSRSTAFARTLAGLDREAIDLLVITGDLLDVPLFLVDGAPHPFSMPEGNDPWLEAARADYQQIRRQLEATGLPFIVLPGNHDHPALFAEVFGNEEPIQMHGGFRVVSFTDYEQECHTPRRLTPSRDRFKAVLKDDDATPQIHLQHYLLAPIPETTYPYHYPEYEFLQKEIEDSGKVVLCLGGHFHQGTPLSSFGRTQYAITPAFCETPHPWRLYEITPKEVSFKTFSQPPAAPAPVAFLDRDGVINDLPSYTTGPEAMRLIPGAAAAIRRLNENGIQAVVATSQSSIGSGYVTSGVVQMVHDRMHQLLAREGAVLDAVYYTRGAGDASVLPCWNTLSTDKAELIRSAAKQLPLDMTRAWIVGDRRSDLRAGADTGIGQILVRTGFGTREAALLTDENATVVDDLAAAVEEIVRALKA